MCTTAIDASGDNLCAIHITEAKIKRLYCLNTETKER